MPSDSRLISLGILNAVDQDNKTLDHLLNSAFIRNGNLPRREKNLIVTIVYGVLRHRGRLDWMLSHFVKTSLAKVDPPVLNILRIGLFQVVYLSRIPASAAVHTAVETAKTLKKPWLAKFVNGVLRSAVREYDRLRLPDPEVDPVAALSIEYSMPEWLIRRWVLRFGIPETRRLCDTVNTLPPLTLRVNTLKTTREALLTSGRIHAGSIEATRCSPDGLRLTEPGTPIDALPGFAEGLFQVQDEAAQLVTLLLDPLPGETVMDACAGMGGKTGHIAQHMQNRGKVLALDVRPEKLNKIQPEMRRMGMEIVETRTRDILAPAAGPDIGKFDRVLLDAPCSGLGVLRRNPDIKWRLSPDRLDFCRSRQIDLLDRISRFVKPGGVLVYAVCSMEPEENEEVAAAFLTAHPEYAVDKNPAVIPIEVLSLLDADGFLRTFPHRDDMDGFFAVRFRRCA